MRVCPICNTKENRVFMKEDAYNNRDHIQLMKCSGCGFVYSKTSAIEYARVCRRHGKTTMSEAVEMSKSEGVADLVSEIISKSKIYQGSVLDFASGIGLIAMEFINKNYDVICVEESDGCKTFHSNNSIPSVSSLEDISDKKGNYDLIIMKDILEHIDDPVGVLKEVTSFLKPDGCLYVRVPNRYAYPFEWRSVDTESHINHFTPRELRELLESLGLRKSDFIHVYDVRSRAGKIYNRVFWRLRNVLPMYHQISMLYKK